MWLPLKESPNHCRFSTDGLARSAFVRPAASRASSSELTQIVDGGDPHGLNDVLAQKLRVLKVPRQVIPNMLCSSAIVSSSIDRDSA